MKNRNAKKWKIFSAVFAIMILAFILILILFNQMGRESTDQGKDLHVTEEPQDSKKEESQPLTEMDYEQAEEMNELEGEYLGYISGFLESGGMHLAFRGADWIADEGEPNGFRIEKSQEPEVVYMVNDDTEYGIIESAVCIQVGKKEFMKRLKEMENGGFQTVFWIKEQNGAVQRIREQYVP